MSATPTTVRRILYTALALLYLLHNDFWLWERLRWVGPLPAGFLYHVAYCVVAALLMALLVRHAWPVAPADSAPQNNP